MGDRARCAMLTVLIDGSERPAGELAKAAGVSAATASGHLQRLVAGGLVTVRSSGRHRYYGLTGPLVAAAIEALSLISPPVEARSLRQSIAATAMAEARSCYDHLAGRAGIALRDTLLASGLLSADGARDFALTDRGLPLPRGTRARSGSDPALTTHAGPRLPRLDRTETASGRGASRGSARPLPRTRLARPPQKRPRRSPSPTSAARTCPPSGSRPPRASSQALPADPQMIGLLCTPGCTQQSIILCGARARLDNSKKCLAESLPTGAEPGHFGGARNIATRVRTRAPG